MRFLALFSLLIGLLLVACGSSKGSPSVVIATVSPDPQAGVAGAPSINQSPLQPLTNPVPAPTGITVGGKPEPSNVASPIAGALPTTVATPATNTAVVDPMAPSTGKWIDVDVTRYRVQLMNGTSIVQTIEPVAVGAQINTGAYESTQTGLFHVYNKIGGLQYDPPYSTYIRDWVGFDQAKANGFHSFLVDQSGTVTDGRTGRISNGCIRTADATAIFNYSEIGMPVYVHL